MISTRVSRLIGIFALIALVVFVGIFPVAIAPNDAVNTIAVFTLISAIAVVGWNIFSGYTGYISLGHAVFYGFGAYTFGLASLYWHIPGGWEPFLLLPLSGLVAGAFALPLGWISLRTQRHTFIVISIAWVFIFQLLAYNLKGFTGGSSGVFMPLTPWVAPYADFPFYYIAFVVLLVAVFVSWWIRHSKFGLGLLAIRDDEDRALSLGIKTNAFKLTAYVVSAFFVAMAGAIFAYYVGSVYPEQGFNPAVDLTIVLMGFLGRCGDSGRSSCRSAVRHAVSAVAGSTIWWSRSEPRDLWCALSGNYLVVTARHRAIFTGKVAGMEGSTSSKAS